MDNTATYQQIVHTWLFGCLEIEDIAKSVSHIGLDGVDLSVTNANPHNNVRVLAKKDLKRVFADKGLEIKVVTPLKFDQNVNADCGNGVTRENVTDFAKRVIELSCAVSCSRMLLAPSMITAPGGCSGSGEEARKTVVERIREVAELAENYGIMLMIEPTNRYRVGLARTIAEAVNLASETGMSNVAVVPDTFHMNIEESYDIPTAIYKWGYYIKTLHVGDNNRRPPGKGTLNWQAILLALDKIGFDGCLSHEPVSLSFNENQVAADPACRLKFEEELSKSVNYLKHCMKEAAAMKNISKQ